MNIGLYYFSGTGTTALITRLLREALEERKGTRVEAVPVEDALGSPGRAAGDFDALGFGFPVYDFRVPGPVAAFIEALPEAVTPKPIFLYAAYGMSMRDCLALASRDYAAKGYPCVASAGFKAPPPILALYAGIRRSPERRRLFRFEENLREKIRGFASEAVSAVASFRPEDPPGLPRKAFLSALGPIASKGSFGRFFYRNLAVDDRCTGCGLCARDCPEGNIALESGRAVPKASNGCLRCLRCVVNCPEKAIDFTVRRRRGDVDPSGWESMLG